MSIHELLQTIGDRVSGASVKSVYGEPVTVGDRTVIPVASVRYAFGGGGGGKKESAEGREGGAGAGGKVLAQPCGALEIGPQGTRFVPFVDPKALGIALAAGAALGALLTALVVGSQWEEPRPESRR